MSEVQIKHQAATKREGHPKKSLTYPERKAVKLTTEKWRRLIDFIANSGYKVNEALEAVDVPRETYNVFVLTDQKMKDAVADAKIAWSRRFWTEEVLEQIYMDIAMGATVRIAVAQNASPLLETDPIISFYGLIANDVEIASGLKASRRIAMDNFADETITIADDDNMDVIFGTDKQGNQIEISNPSAVRRAEVKIRARQWLMGKLYSDMYGDKPLVEINNTIVNHVQVLDSARKRMERSEDRKQRMLADPSVVADQ